MVEDGIHGAISTCLAPQHGIIRVSGVYVVSSDESYLGTLDIDDNRLIPQPQMLSKSVVALRLYVTCTFRLVMNFTDQRGRRSNYKVLRKRTKKTQCQTWNGTKNATCLTGVREIIR